MEIFEFKNFKVRILDTDKITFIYLNILIDSLLTVFSTRVIN